MFTKYQTPAVVYPEYIEVMRPNERVGNLHTGFE